MSGLHEGLPSPTRQRWQPLRIGLVELFHYDTEEFWFREGNLLLRGNNGTGKSKVLALTLPFLLDGDVSAHRVEPDGDAKKRMDWNLLLGGRYPDRTGYTWIEFGRLDDRGNQVHLTLACGLRAATGRGLVDKWFLITDQRVGEGVHLVDSAGIVLGKDRLREQVGAAGTLLDRAEDYRRMVNERLFGLSQHRYDALLTLLVQLRQPQLSKRPDMRALDLALTEALTPLDPAVIADVADAMRTLERDRQDLADLQQAGQAVGSFGRAYARYAGIGTVRRADDVARLTTIYEETGRQLGTARARHDEAATAVTTLVAEESVLRSRVQQLRAREQTLRDSPEMRDARRLDDARRRAEEATAQAKRGSDLRDEAEQRLVGQRRRHSEAAARHDRATEVAGVQRKAANAAAMTSGLDDRTRQGQELELALQATGDQVAADRVVRRRRESQAHMQQVLVSRDTAVTAHASARSAHDGARSQLDEAAESHQIAMSSLEAATVAYLGDLDAAVRGWLVLEEQALPPTIFDQVEEWTASPDGDNPFDQTARDAAKLVTERVTISRTELRAQQAALTERTQDLQHELNGLIDGVQLGPTPSPTRLVEGRIDRAGAPLWQVVDFVEETSADERAGIEAALDGAGLLDAWVTPDGGLLEPGSLDAAITIDPTPVASSASAVLRPARVGPDGGSPAVADDVVGRLLDHIGLGAGTATTWIETSGRFRVGLAEGAWHKPEATFIGYAAREAARQIRITQLRGDLDALAQRLADTEAGLERLDRTDRDIQADLATVPPVHALRKAFSDTRLTLVRQQAASSSLSAMTAAMVRSEEQMTAAETVVAQTAEELMLPTTMTELSVIAEALIELDKALAGLWPRLDALDHAIRALDQAIADVEQADESLQDRTDEADHLQVRMEQSVSEHATLVEMVGGSVEQVVAALAATERERTVTEKDAEIRRKAVEQAREERAKAEGQVELLEDRHGEHRQDRAASVESLRRLCMTGLVEAGARSVDIPDPEQEWSADAGVRLARDLRRELTDVDGGQAAWDRAGSAITESLGDLERTLAAQGGRTWSEPREGALIVGVRFFGQDFAVQRLSAVLDKRMEDRQRLLDAREQQILEDHLVTEVAAQLGQLISEAEQQVSRMNQELTSRPTSTGMVLKLRWDPDYTEGPSGLKEALARLLRQSSGAWTEDDRRALGAFLQAEIRRRRNENEAGTWNEHLTRAFDYRQWHGFKVVRRQGDGSWRTADGPASGGERALAVTLPLFAAASAHYSSTTVGAPRLVLLDEAFAGVDDAARQQCLGLLDIFDLDYVLTSEREWGCYPEVPGLSICHLVRRDDVDAVYVSRWEWDGAARASIDRPPDSAREPASVGEGGGLF